MADQYIIQQKEDVFTVMKRYGKSQYYDVDGEFTSLQDAQEHINGGFPRYFNVAGTEFPTRESVERS